MDDKKRKRNYKKVVRKTYKKYYYPYKSLKSVPKRCPKTEVKYFNYEVDSVISPQVQSGIDLTAVIDPGTGRHERIGDKITVVGVRVRINYRYSTTDASKPHAYVRHFLFWSRVELNNVNAGGTWFHTTDDAGDQMDVVDRPVNKQIAIPLKDKLFHIGHEKVLIEKVENSNNYMMTRSTEKSIGKVDYFLKLNKDIYFSAPEKGNPQLILADAQTSGGNVISRGLVTLYYIDY
jgi:hypothetical protein